MKQVLGEGQLGSMWEWDGKFTKTEGYYTWEELYVPESRVIKRDTFPGALHCEPWLCWISWGQRPWYIFPNSRIIPESPSRWLNTQLALSVEIHGCVRKRMSELPKVFHGSVSPAFWALLKCMYAVVFWYFPYVTKFTSLISQSSQKGNWWYMWTVWLLWERIQLRLSQWFHPKS